MFIAFLAAAALAAQSLSAADDPRATAGVAVFFDLCGATVAKVEAPIDPARFKFTKLSAETVNQLRPMSKGQPFWDVQDRQTKLRALVHIETNGVCALEIVEASEQATRTQFANKLQALAAGLGGTLAPQPDKVKKVDGKPMTSSEWLIVTASQTFRAGLTTYPDARFMTQHIAMLTEDR